MDNNVTKFTLYRIAAKEMGIDYSLFLNFSSFYRNALTMQVFNNINSESDFSNIDTKKNIKKMSLIKKK